MTHLERGMAPNDMDWEPSDEDLRVLELDDHDMAGLYIRDQGQASLLTPAQEIELGKRIQLGKYTTNQHLIADAKEARKAFATANTRLVVSIAKKYIGRGLPFGDIVGNGNVGLMEAVDKFDPDRGFRFSTFATWWIRQAIIRGLANQARTIRVPVDMSDRIQRVTRIANELEQDLGRVPTCDEISEATGLSADMVQFVLDVRRPVVSLDSPLGQDGDNEFGDILADPDAIDIEESVHNELLKDVLVAEVGRLSDEERFVLTRRYGLDGNREYTLRELAHALGKSPEWIRQLEARALRELRHPTRSKKLWKYYT